MIICYVVLCLDWVCVLVFRRVCVDVLVAGVLSGVASLMYCWLLLGIGLLCSDLWLVSYCFWLVLLLFMFGWNCVLLILVACGCCFIDCFWLCGLE